jgi:hypothetical protein
MIIITIIIFKKRTRDFWNRGGGHHTQTKLDEPS